MTEHIKTRNKLKEIVEIQTFSDLLDRCILSEEDRRIMELHYLQDRDLRYIGDLLGYSEGTIKKRHRKVLKKLNQIL